MAHSKLFTIGNGIGTGTSGSVSVLEPNRLSTGTIIGIAVGVGVGVIALIALTVLCCRCFRRRSTPSEVLNYRHSRSSAPPHNVSQARQKGPLEVQTTTHQNIIPGANVSTVSGLGEHTLPQIPLSPLSTAQEMSGAHPARSWDDLRGRGRNFWI